MLGCSKICIKQFDEDAYSFVTSVTYGRSTKTTIAMMPAINPYFHVGKWLLEMIQQLALDEQKSYCGFLIDVGQSHVLENAHNSCHKVLLVAVM